MNIHIFQIVLDLQHKITHIPGQINRQQLVYFEDALGYSYRLDIEFIISKEVRITNIIMDLFQHD